MEEEDEDEEEEGGKTCLSGTFPPRFRKRALVRNERTIAVLKSISSNNRDLSIREREHTVRERKREAIESGEKKIDGRGF